MPRISATPRTSSWIGSDDSSMATATPAACAISLRTVATPPRVASRMKWTSMPASRSAAVKPFNGIVSLRSVLRLEVDVAAGEHHGAAVVPHRTAQDHDVTGPHDALDRDALRQRDDANSRRRDEELIRLAAGHDLGVTGDDADARAIRCAAASTPRPCAGVATSRPSSRMNAAEMPSGVAPPTARSLIGAVDGELTDVAAGEEERADHERVGRDREPDVVDARDREDRLVAELVEHRVAEDVAEERGDQRVAGFAPGAVAHRDRVLAKRRSALADLGDALEDALLGIGDARGRCPDGCAASRLDDGVAHRACTAIGCSPCSAPCAVAVAVGGHPDASTRSRSRAREYRPKL